VLALPEVLIELKLPYHEEFLLARGMKNGKNKKKKLKIHNKNSSNQNENS
jgi:hypothetical protein